MMSKTQSIPTYICAVLLTAIVAATIFSSDFRKDILAGSGEAQVLGVLSATGAVLVLLVALFLGGLILSARLMTSHRRTTTRDIKNEQELFSALQESYPGAPLSSLRVVEVPIEGDDLTLKYLQFPLLFVETFLINRE